MDTSQLVELLSGLIGGLGIFLFGMKSMSDGMQAVAGNSLRRLIGAVTRNRFFATGVGTVVTCIVQSSSVTTVMVVGFVNSGLMDLTQAVGVIMGANIGTTITGWILVLQVGKAGLPMLGVAAFAYLFSRGDRWRYTALAIMGIGMVFFGLELMKDACAVIKKMPEFEAWFKAFRADTMFGVFKCIAAGCILTMLVQSSSATLGITISLASQGVINFESAAALVLGENIGTTITALLAAIGANTNARRAAFFHTIFNLVGVLWISLIFRHYIGLVQWLTDGDSTALTRSLAAGALAPDPTEAIATTHTLFNVANTLLFMPFVPLCVALLQRIVPTKAEGETTRLTELDVRMLETPTMAIEQSHRELRKMGQSCSDMLGWVAELMNQDHPDKSLADRLKQREQLLDGMQDEIAAFVTDLLSGNVPHALAEEGRSQLRMADEFESISDYLADIDKFDRKLRRDGHRFGPEQRDGLAGLNRLVSVYLTAVNDALLKRSTSVLIDTETASKRVRLEIKQLRRRHLEELSGGTSAPSVTVAFLATLNAYGRVRDHAHNIAEAIAGEK
ncbi:MAG TPA: sodium:phosphate symporter [Planctomycetaceae bacterium]|nr:sodium:phosphate symporter [Planctomycetaceae bacterium]HRF01646.1 Na/Pi cotransporter family protein [Pirellulaceae bacterium]